LNRHLEEKEDVKIAVSAEGPDLKANIAHRLGLAPYLLIIDFELDDFKVVGSPNDSRRGGGMQVVALVIANKCRVLLTGYCSPMAESYLSNHGVKVITGLSGTVGKILQKYKEENAFAERETPGEQEPIAGKFDRIAVVNAVQKAFHQIQKLLPVMISVVFLVGLFNTFIIKEYLLTFFSGTKWLDSLLGALIGSLFAGNPINSYIIGGQLLELGISLAAVTAFLCSWVTVGVLQMPAEIEALGWKFTAVRNLSCFGLSIIISLFLVFISKLLRG
jgi:predicted Fe-Mo cluster-binding NifX family protein